MSWSTGVPSEARAISETTPPTAVTSEMPRAMSSLSSRCRRIPAALSLRMTPQCYTIAIVFIACVPPAPQPAAPVALHTARNATEVVQIASRELTGAGFEISTSDAVAGVLTAKRTREKRGNHDLIACQYAKDSIGETNMTSTLTVSVSATPGQSGSEVRVITSVLTRTVDLTGLQPHSESTSVCASTGAIEKQVADAVK